MSKEIKTPAWLGHALCGLMVEEAITEADIDVAAEIREADEFAEHQRSERDW